MCITCAVLEPPWTLPDSPINLVPSRKLNIAGYCIPTDTTVVLAAVYGPRSVPGYKEEAEKCAVEVVFKPRSDVPGLMLQPLFLSFSASRLSQRHPLDYEG